MAWLAQNPSAPFAEFEQRFGTPEAVAATYVTQAEPEVLLKKLRIWRPLLLFLLCGVIVTVAIGGILWFRTLHQVREEAKKGVGGTMRITTIEGPVERISDGTLPRTTSDEIFYDEVVYGE